MTRPDHTERAALEAQIAEANADWAAIPTGPAAIRVWMRREPLNPVTPEE
jgi:hypothetical protein